MAPLLLRLLLPLLALLSVAAAQKQQQQQVRIYNQSTKYTYHGCYNETTQVDGSDRSRALADGINQVRRGQMTVPLCLGFCANGRTQYRYAGLEWSRCVFHFASPSFCFQVQRMQSTSSRVTPADALPENAGALRRCRAYPPSSTMPAAIFPAKGTRILLAEAP